MIAALTPPFYCRSNQLAEEQQTCSLLLLAITPKPRPRHDARDPASPGPNLPMVHFAGG